MVNEETKKIAAAGIVGLVLSGLTVGAVMNGKNSDLADANNGLSNQVKILEASVQVAQQTADASREAQVVLNKQIGDLNDGVVNLQETLSVKDAEIIALTAEISAQVANEEVTTENGAIISGTGYVIDDISLDGNFDATLKDNKVETLLDGELTFDGEEYKYEEVIETSGLKPLISSVNDEDFGKDIYVGADNDGAVEYRFVFKDGEVLELVNDEDINDEINIVFLGKALKITEFNSGSDFTYKEATKTIAVIGDEVAGVKILNIGENSVLVQYGTETAVLTEDNNEENVGGMDVRLDSVFYVDEQAERMVVIEAGEDIEKTVEDGDSMELFGEPSREGDAEWVWSVGADFIGAKHNQKMDDLGDDFTPLAVGEQIVLPNDYAALTFAGTNDVDMAKITTDFKNDELVIKADSEIFVVDGSNYDTLYIDSEGLYVEDGDDRINETAENFYIEQEDNNLPVNIDEGTLNIGDYSISFDLEEGTITDVTGISNKIDGDTRTIRGDIFYNLEDVYDVEEDVDSIDFDIAYEPVTVNLKVD